MSSVKKKGPNLAQQISFLQKLPFFEDFDQHEIKQFLALSRWLKVPADTHIIKESSIEKVFYILVKGSVSVVKTLENGSQSRLTTLAAGDCFGEMALVSETRRTAGVVTLEKSFILMVEPDIINKASVFLQLKFYRRFCEILVGRLVNANKRLAKADSGKDIKDPKKSLEDQIEKKYRISDGEPANSFFGKGGTIQKEVTEEDDYDPAELPPMPKRKPLGKMKLRRLIQEDGLVLQMNPAVAAQLSPFLLGHCEDTRRFSEIISLDPVITAKVLQMANSSFYRRTTPVMSVPHALITVGINHIQELLGEETIKILVKNQFGGFTSLAKSFWSHSVVVARIAELLKDVMRVHTTIDVYVAGLLHDIGFLALDPLKPGFYPQLLRQDFPNHLSEAEKEYIGVDHGQAGSWLGEKLGLPLPYRDVMKYHHFPEKMRDHGLLTGLVHLADLFAEEQGCCFGGKKCQEVNLHNSYAWVLIQDQHAPFRDVNIADFISSFRTELDREWPEISKDISW